MARVKRTKHTEDVQRPAPSDPSVSSTSAGSPPPIAFPAESNTEGTLLGREGIFQRVASIFGIAIEERKGEERKGHEHQTVSSEGLDCKSSQNEIRRQNRPEKPMLLNDDAMHTGSARSMLETSTNAHYHSADVFEPLKDVFKPPNDVYYSCWVSTCEERSFPSITSVQQHLREAHGMCVDEDCYRSFGGNGFPMRWNLLDHMKRVHHVTSLTSDIPSQEQSRYNSHPCSVCSHSFETQASLLRHSVEVHGKAPGIQEALETLDDADSSSDESHNDSIFSRPNQGSSVSSMPRIPIWREARDVIVPIIAKNGVLMPLYHHALRGGGIMSFDRFEHRFRQIFQHYCSDLKEEADNISQKETVKILKLSADRMVHEIHELCQPADHTAKQRLALLKQQKTRKHEEVEQYLRKTMGSNHDKPGMEAVDEQADNVEADDSDPDDDRVSEHLFPNINNIKAFLVSGTPFTRFHESIRNFVYHIDEAYEAPSPLIEHAQCPQKLEDDEISWRDHRRLIPSFDIYDSLTASSHYLGNAIQTLMNDHLKHSRVSSFVLALRDQLRPSVLKGHQRVTWECGCGKYMYADVQESYLGGAEDLQTSLKKAAADARRIRDLSAQEISRTDCIRTHNQSNEDATSPSTFQETPNAGNPENGAVLSPSSTFTTLAGTDLSLTSSGETVSEQPPVLLKQQYLLLCVNTTSTAKLEQIQIPYSADDQVMFQDIRRAYLKVRQARTQTFHPETPDLVRRLITWSYDLISLTQKTTIKVFQFLRLHWLVWWIGDVVFYIPTSANFVRFELIPIKTEICPEVISFPDLPPIEEVRDKKTYHYAPCPQSVKNPVLRIPYLHVLFEPGIHLDRFWSNRVPKKLDTKIMYGDGIDPVIGWGVHIVEGPNWLAFSVLSELVLVLSAVVALTWSLLARDVSGGFAIGAYMVGVLAVGNALGIVMLCQQR